MSARGLTLVGGGLTAVLLLSGCHASASIGSKTISKSDIEQKAATALAASAHTDTPTVVCPGDLNAKVGATITCNLTSADGSEKHPVLVTVKTVDGTDVNLDFQVQ